MVTAWKAFGALACCVVFIGSIALVAKSGAQGAQDKYSVEVPGGLGFSEFKGYESWETVSVSYNGGVLAVTVANPVMINAYKGGFPADGKAVPDGAKMAKIHWIPKQNEFFPEALVPGVQRDVDFMVKDSKRFGDGGGWGYAFFVHDAASDTFRPATSADTPPQNNDAKCGVACHGIVKSKDYVFTEYGRR
jgi:hypothetical protein